jgi:hypothetical protein
MKLVKRYNTEIKAWEVGYWINNTRFVVVDIVFVLEDAQRLYDKVA